MCLQPFTMWTFSLRLLLLQQLGALAGVGAVLAAEDHQQRHLQLGQALPHRLGRSCGAGLAGAWRATWALRSSCPMLRLWRMAHVVFRDQVRG